MCKSTLPSSVMFYSKYQCLFTCLSVDPRSYQDGAVKTSAAFLGESIGCVCYFLFVVSCDLIG